jgi:hypothetical protein
MRRNDEQRQGCRRLWLASAGLVASLLLLLVTGGSASANGCAQPHPFSYGLSLGPAYWQLPSGASATFQATGGVGPMKVGQEIAFKVVCGPNAGTTRRETAKLHPESQTPGVPSAYFAYIDRKGSGTDLISTTTRSSSGRSVTATISVAWSPPIDCGQPLPKLGYLLALQCKLAQAKPLVDTVLKVGECAVGVLTFLAPEAKLANLVQDADKAATVELLARDAAVSSPVAKFAFDLAQIQKNGIVSFAQLRSSLEDAHSLPSFLHNIASLLGAVPSFEASRIALDVANLIGLGPCVDLLSKIITTPAHPSIGATSIARAPTLIPGRTYRVDLRPQPTARLAAPGETQTGGVCPMWAGKWWRLHLQAGDTVSVSWTDRSPSSGFYQYLIFSPNTTDQTVTAEANNNHQLQFVNSASNSGSGTFSAASSGSYPFIIGDGCPSTSGPFQFVVNVTHASSAGPGATTIAAAPALIPGHSYLLDLRSQPTARLAAPGETQTGGVCPMWAGEWWRLNLQAGDTVSVSWTVSSPSSGFYQYLIFSPNTTDQTVNLEANNNQQLQFVNSAGNSESGTFSAASSGSYPFIIGDGCPSTSGPFQFVVQVTAGHA